jgi:hypothetical protein
VHPYRRKINPTTLLQQEQSRPNFNLNLIEYIHETHSYSKEYLSKVNFNIFNTNLTNIEPSTFDALRNLQNNQDITITQTDKNMGWALLPTTWFTNEYK